VSKLLELCGTDKNRRGRKSVVVLTLRGTIIEIGSQMSRCAWSL